MSSDDARMTFTEHLGELRTRIIRSAVALMVGFGVAYLFSKPLCHLVASPLLKDKHLKWVTLNPLEGFVVTLKLSLYAGALLALPVIVYQIAAFIFPGLTARERKMVQTMLCGGGLLAMAGVLVAYLGVFPLVLPYLTAFSPDFVESQLRLSETVAQILMFLLGFVVVFQFPMVVLTLVYLELLSPATLRHYRRMVIVAIAVASAVFTPPDPVSMVVMMVPMVVLYEVSIWLSYLMMRSKKNKASA